VLLKVWSRLGAVLFKSRIDAEIAEELRSHIHLRTQGNLAAGMSPEEARRDAQVRFGGMESIKEACRDVRGGGILDVLIQDVRFAFRMFRKYPTLSSVSVIAMSLAIAVAAGYFGVFGALMDPTLPIPAGYRVVSIQNAVVTRQGHDQQTLRDFVAWRDQLKTVQELGAFAKLRRNLVLSDRPVEPIDLAAISASGLRIARTAPLLGRILTDDDEREGAPPVIVIAYEEWQRLFNTDPDILGREVQIGNEVHTIVGVMPKDFRFPVNHRYWVALRMRLSEIESGSGPALFIFGRLADGATYNEAQAEISVIGSRMAASYPETHADLRPRVLPYTYPFVGIHSPEVALQLRGVQIAVGLLLILVSANVAILIYARTATRMGEIALRAALGATRKRIISQLFLETFVLSATAAVVGLTIAAVAFKVIKDYQARESDYQSPFWVHHHVTPGMVAYVVLLAIVAGVVAGVGPALKATGRRVQPGLQQLPSRGSQQQLGRTWTALIVIQVAIAVAVLPSAIYIAAQSVMRGTAPPGYAAGEVLRASLSMDRAESASETGPSTRSSDPRFLTRAGELLRRLEAEPAVTGVTFSSYFPGGERFERVEVEGATQPDHAASPSDGWVRSNSVGPHFFNLLGVPTLAGRPFVDGDTHDPSTAVVVDKLFVERFLANEPALGRRVRLLQRSSETPEERIPGPWLEIVGVVPDFTAQADFAQPDPTLYRPIALTQAPDILRLVIRLRGGSAPAFAAKLRDIAAALDPALQLDDVGSAADAERHAQQALLYVAIAIVAVTASVLLLSATGIYAMMSFTVTKRRREIGIRIALGADARHILTGVFARASGQLGIGVLTGLALAIAVDRVVGGGAFTEERGFVLPAVVTIILSGGFLAALGPARRGLAIQPSEALREE
jgi:putative ABC transport system permease protein